MAFCHKQDSLMRGMVVSVDHGRWLTHKCYNLYYTDETLTTHDGPAKPGTGRQLRFLPELVGPLQNIAIMFGKEK